MLFFVEKYFTTKKKMYFDDDEGIRKAVTEKKR